LAWAWAEARSETWTTPASPALGEEYVAGIGVIDES